MLTPAYTSTRTVLEDLLAQRILLLDGAMGTMVHAHKPTEEDYRGPRFRKHSRLLQNCTEVLTLSQPRMIEDIHRGYLEAGADIIETNTFNSNALSMAEYDLQENVLELNEQAAHLARRAADAMNRRTPERPRFVAGSLGPTNKTLCFSRKVEDAAFRDVTFDQMAAAYTEQIHGLVRGGVDILLAETSFDTLNLKACLFAIDEYFERHQVRLPVMVSFTIFQGGRTLTAQTIEACWTSLAHFDMLSVGINCALGGEQMRPYVETLSSLAPVFTSCYPNAGLPNELGEFDDTPEHMVRILAEFAHNGWVNVVGGCCGSTPAHIRTIAEAVKDVRPRTRPRSRSGPVSAAPRRCGCATTKRRSS